MKAPRTTQQINIEFYSAYKKIRNRFRKFDPNSIFFACCDYLVDRTNDELEEFKKAPWLVFLLLKWVFEDEQASQKRRPQIDRNSLNRLLKAMHDAANVCRLPTENDHFYMSLRGIISQQFIYQQNFLKSSLARDLLFFDKDNFETIDKAFETKNHLSVREFLELAFTTASLFLSPNKPVFINQYSYGGLDSVFPPGKMQQFLALISIPLDKLNARLSNSKNPQITANEHDEITPFVDFPLIESNGNYYCPHHKILFYCFENYIYRFLRKQNNEKFTRRFSNIFEQHIDNLLASTTHHYVRERDIKNAYHKDSKVVDFIIGATSGNVFIDAKAIEMPTKGKTTHVAEILSDRSKAVISAIKQAHETLEHVKNGELDKLKISQKTQNFLIVITYKELYLINGKSFYEMAGKNSMDEIYRGKTEDVIIPPENIFFISIEDFEYLISAITQSGKELIEILENNREADSNSQTSKLIFSMHLKRLVPEISHHPMMAEQFSKLTKGLFEQLPETNPENKDNQ